MTPSSITPEQARERVARAMFDATDRGQFACDAELAALGLSWADAAALMAGTAHVISDDLDPCDCGLTRLCDCNSRAAHEKESGK